MRNFLVHTFFIVFVAMNSYAQIDFVAGYFIDNNDQKTTCLIRNVDWMNNPIEFKYKVSDEAETQTAIIDEVKEFGVLNKSKYIRATVDLDTSSDKIGSLTRIRNPSFSSQVLFLKMLVEGKANLYVYENNNGRKYFYNKELSEIKPLIYKRFTTSDNEIAENNQYSQQLFNDLKYEGLNQHIVSKIEYNEKSLRDFFLKYNTNFGIASIDFNEASKRDLFNLTLRPGVKNSSLLFQYADRDVARVQYDNELSFRFGAELELILPFNNNNKWSLLVEPSYQYYKTEKEIWNSIIASVNYNSIELSMGARHYMYLNDTSKIFVNAAYVLALSGNSKIEYSRGSDIALYKSSNAAFGVGYNYKNTYSVEFNYHLDRGLIKNLFREGLYSSYSIIFGYTLL